MVKDTTATNDTILKDKFNAVTKYTYLVGMDFDSKKNEYTYTNDSTTAQPYAIASADQLPSFVLKSKTDYSALMGQKVKVIYKNNTNKDVYGIFADKDSKVLAQGVIGDIGTIKTDSFKFDGKVYKVDGTTATTPIYSFVNTTADWAGMNTNSLGNVASIPAAIEPFTMKMVDADNDGKVDYLVAVPFTVAKATFVGSTAMTVGNVSYKFEDCNIDENIKKDDWVVITAAVNTAKDEPVLVKADVVTGAIKAIKSPTEITLDGTAYTAAASYTPPTFAMNDSFKLVVVNGYFFNASKVSATASSTNVCLVTALDSATNAINGTLDVQILLADGTKKIVKVEKANTTAGGALVDVAAPINTPTNALVAGELAIGQIYTYEVNSDGYYELSRVVASDYDAYATGTTVTNTVGGDVANGAAITSIKDGKVVVSGAGTYYFKDDAVVFYKTTSDYKVASGAAANKWAEMTAGLSGILYANKESGFFKTEVALLNIGVTPDAGDTAYGWVVSNPVLVKEGKDYYLQLKIWDGSKDVTVKADKYSNTNTGTSTSYITVGSSTNASTLANLQKGNPVSFRDSGDGFITNIQGFSAAMNAVTAYNDSKSDVGFTTGVTGTTGAAATLLTIEKDTVIFFVDTANNTGLTGGSITVASNPTGSFYVRNCYVLGNIANEIKVIVVDTTNNLASNSSTVTFATSGSVTNLASNVLTVTANTTRSTLVSDLAAAFTGELAIEVSGTSFYALNGQTVTVYATDGTAKTYTISTSVTPVTSATSGSVTAINNTTNEITVTNSTTRATLLTDLAAAFTGELSITVSGTSTYAQHGQTVTVNGNFGSASSKTYTIATNAMWAVPASGVVSGTTANYAGTVAVAVAPNGAQAAGTTITVTVSAAQDLTATDDVTVTVYNDGVAIGSVTFAAADLVAGNESDTITFNVSGDVTAITAVKAH